MISAATPHRRWHSSTTTNRPVFGDRLENPPLVQRRKGSGIDHLDVDSFGAQPPVSGDWLEARLDDPTVRVIEIQYEADSSEYDDGYMPGAVNWYWKDVLCIRWNASSPRLS